MSTQWVIPKDLKVGYKNRSDTYTDKLGFITYLDRKGKLKKEKSFTGWIEDELGIDDFKNEPTSGFVLNRNGGGVIHSYGRNARKEFVRVYDPRDFEIEVSFDNLILILENADCIRGKGLVGDFVYGWNGQTLVLLPVDSKEYKEATQYTSLQTKKVTKKDMVLGSLYKFKDEVEAIYLGRELVYEWGWGSSGAITCKKKHVFKTIDCEYSTYKFENGFTKIAERLTTEPCAEFANEYDSFKKSKHGTLEDCTLRANPDSLGKMFKYSEDVYFTKKYYGRSYPFYVIKISEDKKCYRVSMSSEEEEGYLHSVGGFENLERYGLNWVNKYGELAKSIGFYNIEMRSYVQPKIV